MEKTKERKKNHESQKPQKILMRLNICFFNVEKIIYLCNSAAYRKYLELFIAHRISGKATQQRN